MMAAQPRRQAAALVAGVVPGLLEAIPQPVILATGVLVALHLFPVHLLGTQVAVALAYKAVISATYPAPLHKAEVLAAMVERQAQRQVPELQILAAAAAVVVTRHILTVHLEGLVL